MRFGTLQASTFSNDNGLVGFNSALAAHLLGILDSVGLALSSTGNLYAVDSGSGRVQVFDLSKRLTSNFRLRSV